MLSPRRRGKSFPSSLIGGRSSARGREGEFPWVFVGEAAGASDKSFHSSFKIAEGGGVQFHEFRYAASNAVIVGSLRIVS